jgi:hypothetical protein
MAATDIWYGVVNEDHIGEDIATNIIETSHSYRLETPAASM